MPFKYRLLHVESQIIDGPDKKKLKRSCTFVFD